MKIAYEKASKNCHTAQHSICQLKESTKQYKTNKNFELIFTLFRKHSCFKNIFYCVETLASLLITLNNR